MNLDEQMREIKQLLNEYVLHRLNEKNSWPADTEEAEDELLTAIRALATSAETPYTKGYQHGWDAALAGYGQAQPTQQKPFAYAYRYPDGIRFDNSGREVNCCKPTGTVALYTKPQPTEQEPIGWLEAPHGAFRANPNVRIEFPPQSISWNIPVYLDVQPKKPASAWCACAPTKCQGKSIDECRWCVMGYSPLRSPAVRLSDQAIYEMYDDPRSDAEMLAFARELETAALRANGLE